MSAALQTVTIICLLIGAASAAIIVFDELGHPQDMWIMNVVWPITALSVGPLALWGYFTASRRLTKSAVKQAKEGKDDPLGSKKPLWLYARGNRR